MSPRFLLPFQVLGVIVMIGLAFIGAITAIRDLAAPKPSVLASIAVATPPERQEPRQNYRGLPPIEYRGDLTLTVHFVDNVEERCGDDAYACGGPNGLTLPNPCKTDALAEVGWDKERQALAMRRYWGTEEYRTTVCHELGHANGWPGSHWIDPETEIAAVRAELIKHMYADDQIYGATPARNYVWRVGEGPRTDAALKRMIETGDVVVTKSDRYGDQIRLSRCLYWTLDQDMRVKGPRTNPKSCEQRK